MPKLKRGASAKKLSDYKKKKKNDFVEKLIEYRKTKKLTNRVAKK